MVFYKKISTFNPMSFQYPLTQLQHHIMLQRPRCNSKKNVIMNSWPQAFQVDLHFM